MRARMHGLGLGLLLVVAISVPAFAQQPGPSPSSAKTDYVTCAKDQNSEAAHAKYLAGKVDYDEGNYESAIANFRQAYEKDCAKHELLVIISRAYEASNNKAEAIRALETYVEKANPPDAATHRAKIATLKERLADEKRKAAATPAPTAPPAGGNPPGETREHTIYPWLVVGGGVIAASIGVVLLVAKPDTNCDLSTRTCVQEPGESEAAYEDRQKAAGREAAWGVAGPVLIVGGAAMIVGGLVWHFLEPTGPKDSAKTKVQPQVGPGFGGFALTGRF